MRLIPLVATILLCLILFFKKYNIIQSCIRTNFDEDDDFGSLITDIESWPKGHLNQENRVYDDHTNKLKKIYKMYINNQ